MTQIFSQKGEFIGSVNRLNAQFRVLPDQFNSSIHHILFASPLGVIYSWQ